MRRASVEPALICNGQTLTYDELNRWSGALSARLRAAGGGGPGRPVVLLAPAGLEYFAALLAIWKAGAMAVPLQPSHPAEELKYALSDSESAAILAHPDCISLAEKLGGASVRLTIDREAGTTDSFAPVIPEAGALMIYTSGTTGKPKGVVLSYANLDAQISSLLQAWEWTEHDRTLNVLPLHHVHGVVAISGCALAAGACMELAPKFSPEMVWDRIARRKINVFMAVPTVYSRLLDHYEMQTPEVQREWSRAARGMRLMVSGSAALPIPLFESWRKLAGQALLERYGMTEIGMALSNPYHGERKAGRVGMPLPGVEVRLSHTGEIEVRGPGVFSGYWKKDEATRQGFTPDAWFRTGDIAECDEHGSYKILGRASQDIIKSGGYKISALEIESVLLQHPKVREAAVVGVPDDEWGERVAAAIVATGLVLPDPDLIEFAREHLAKYKVPTLWKLASSLPRNPMGKVIKPKVRELF